MDEQFDWAVLQLAALKIRAQNRREIERAIDRLKGPRPRADDWLRRHWYRAAAQRRKLWIRDPMPPAGDSSRSNRVASMSDREAGQDKLAESMAKLDSAWERRKARVIRQLSETPLEKWIRRRR